jgi:NADH-quinone oxidoreductase subunit E
MDVEAILATVQKYQGKRGALISILEEVQARHGYLPADALEAVAAGMGRSLVDVYGVATFYRAFRLKPRGKHLCSVCLGTACHVRGAPRVEEEVEKQLGVTPGGTTPDKEFTLETVNCLGACALGPVVVVDGKYFSGVSTTRVKEIIRQSRAGLDKVEVRSDPRVFPIAVNCSRCNHTLMDPDHSLDGAPSIRLTAAGGGSHGRLWLSSFYGSDTVDSDVEMPMHSTADLYCPHCHSELRGPWSCPECEAPMASLIVRAGGVLQVCSRRGCKGRMLDVC